MQQLNGDHERLPATKSDRERHAVKWTARDLQRHGRLQETAGITLDLKYSKIDR